MRSFRLKIHAQVVKGGGGGARETKGLGRGKAVTHCRH